jgi:type I restriction enzyme S subunit
MSSEWRSGRLGDFIELKRGYDLPKERRSSGPIPLVSSSGISDCHSEAMVQGPGVVTGRYGTIGQVYFVEGAFWPLNTTLYVRDFKSNDPKFISYFLRTVDFFAYSDKAAVPGVNRNHLHEALASMPDRSTQIEIAACLGALDDRIALLRETNATLEAIAQALFKSWFVDFDPVRAKQQGLAPAGMDETTAALFPDSFEESALGLVPKGWDVLSLGDLCTFQKGCSYKGDGLSDSEGAFMFNLGCFNAPRVFATEKIKRYTGEYKERHSVVADDLIVANTDMTQERAILGRPLFVPTSASPGFISHHVFKLCFTQDDVGSLKQFLFYSFLQPTFRERAVGYATGTTVLALPRDALESHQLLLPSKRLLDKFGELCAPAHKAISNNLERAQSLVILRDTLLPRLISGQLRMPEATLVPKAA